MQDPSTGGDPPPSTEASNTGGIVRILLFCTCTQSPAGKKDSMVWISPLNNSTMKCERKWKQSFHKGQPVFRLFLMENGAWNPLKELLLSTSR